MSDTKQKPTERLNLKDEGSDAFYDEAYAIAEQLEQAQAALAAERKLVDATYVITGIPDRRAILKDIDGIDWFEFKDKVRKETGNE